MAEVLQMLSDMKILKLPLNLSRASAHILVICLTFFVSSIGFSSENHGPSDRMRNLAKLETSFNPAVRKSGSILQLQHYEVPFRLVRQDLSDKLNPKVLNALFFSKDGEPYIRWVIHPHDRIFHKKIRKFLSSNNLDSDPKSYLRGFLTSSRSLLILDPSTGYEFGLKVSSNRSGGPFQSFKGQSYKNAQKNRRVDEMLEKGRESFEHESFTFLNEPAAFGIQGLSTGMLVRDFDMMFTHNRHYVPVFSLFTNEYSEYLADYWEMENNAELWQEVLYRPLGRAMAELEILYGIRLNSPHSQNLLLELNDEFVPTGRIVFRDIGDLRIHSSHLEAIGYGHIPPLFNITSKLSKDRPHIDVAIRHGMGNAKVVWWDWKKDKQSNLQLIGEFEKTAAKLLGLGAELVVREKPKRFIVGEPISMAVAEIANRYNRGGVIQSDTIWYSKNYPDLADSWRELRPELKKRINSRGKGSIEETTCSELLSLAR